jgi:rubrerythrin
MSDKAIEILKSAIMLERRGKAFYTQAAETAKSPEVKGIFQNMAKEEDLHIEQLSRQFAQYQKDQTFLPVAKASDDVQKTVLNREMRGEIQAAGFEAAAISAAMAMEERAVKLYADRAEAATDANEKALYTWLAAWEREHVRLLEQIDRELTEKVWHDNNFWPF